MPNEYDSSENFKAVKEVIEKEFPVSKMLTVGFDKTDYRNFEYKDKYGNIYFVEVLQRTARIQIRVGMDQNMHMGYLEISVNKEEHVSRALAVLFHSSFFDINPDYHSCPYQGCSCHTK